MSALVNILETYDGLWLWWQYSTTSCTSKNVQLCNLASCRLNFSYVLSSFGITELENTQLI